MLLTMYTQPNKQFTDTLCRKDVILVETLKMTGRHETDLGKKKKKVQQVPLKLTTFSKDEL